MGFSFSTEWSPWTVKTVPKAFGVAPVISILEICHPVLGRPSDIRFFEQLPHCSGVAPFFDALCVNRPKFPHHLPTEQVPPCPTLTDANRFELSRRFHSPASLRSFTVSNGPGFREQEQPSVLPLSSALNALYLPGLPSLRLPGCQPDQQPSGFPALSASYCVRQRRRSPCRVIATLTHFRGFSAARFQSRSPTRPNTSTNYRLVTKGHQRL